MLSCTDLELTLGARPILKNVSLQIRQGEVTALLGPSGAGKSTLLRSLAFLETPQSGFLELDGAIYQLPISARSLHPRPWPRVTAVFQQHFLWPHLTLEDNIRLPLRLRQVPRIDAVVRPLIEHFGMLEFASRFPNEVSGGERQRAALVRALALNPSYILLDEITSALDADQALSIVRHLRNLKLKEIGIMIVTHHLGFLRRTADQVVYMEKGVVIESGSRDILAAPCTPALCRYMHQLKELEE